MMLYGETFYVPVSFPAQEAPFDNGSTLKGKNRGGKAFAFRAYPFSDWDYYILKEMIFESKTENSEV